MIEVKFYDKVSDDLLKFAVIFSTMDGKFVLCKHKERTTYECPGGHREPGESIEETARRELYEETGAKEFNLFPIIVYSVIRKNDDETQKEEESFGMLYYADIKELGALPELEIEQIVLMDKLPTAPEDWTYPLIQPKLIEKIMPMIKLIGKQARRS